MKTIIILFAIALSAIFTFSNCQKKEMGTMACCTVPSTGTVGHAVNFSSSCSMNATDYKWMFGDGDSSMDATTTHTYTTAATFTVTLMAMKGSKMDQTSKSITIH